MRLFPEKVWRDVVTDVIEPPAPEPAKSSLIGNTVATLIRARNVQISEEQRLTEEIAILVEERRQRRKQIEAMTAALAAIGDDPALTTEEQTDVAANRDVYINSIDIGL